MTTATDWDVTDTETGEHPVVTDVTSAVTDHAMELEQTHALAIRNAELSEEVRRLTDLVERLEADKRAAHIDLGRLQAELDRRGWLPTTEQMRDADQREIESAADLTERERMAALTTPITELFAVDSEGMPLTPIAADSMWPTWLGDVHRADATLVEQVGGLRSWADSYAARPVERTVVEPVAVDYSYRQTEAALYAQMVVSAAEEHVASVYDELAPDRIQDGPPEHDRQGQDPDLTPEHQRQGTDPDLTPEHERKADARSRAVLAPLAQPATQVGGQGDTYNETPPRVGGWRVWAASAAIGIVGLAATIGALVVLA